MLYFYVYTSDRAYAYTLRGNKTWRAVSAIATCSGEKDISCNNYMWEASSGTPLPITATTDTVN